MAQAFAEKVGATLRQVQLWTDQGVIKCLPETKHQGRGRKRLYDLSELPIGSLAAVLARMQFTIGVLEGYADIVRNFLHEKQPERHYEEERPRDWYRRAFRAQVESWMVFIPELVDGKLWFSWEEERTIAKLLKTRRVCVLVNVKPVISAFVT